MSSDTLVIQPLPGIGDMVWHLPALHAIAAQSRTGTVDVLTKPRSKADQLLQGDKSVSEVLWLNRDGQHKGVSGMLALARELKHRHYQSVWVLHDSLRYLLAARLAGVPRRVGYGPAWRKLLLSDCACFSRKEMKLHPIEKAALLFSRRFRQDLASEPELLADADALAAMKSRFPALGKGWIAVGIGSSEPVKQWGAVRFSELCIALGEIPGVRLVLVGGPGEADIAAQIVQAASRRNIDIATGLDLNIRDTVALLSLCSLYVGNDTGFLNVAAATGVHAMGLFGGSPPLRHAGHIHCVLPDDGSQPEYGTPFMDRISVATVLQSCRQLLPDVMSPSSSVEGKQV